MRQKNRSHAPRTQHSGLLDRAAKGSRVALAVVMTAALLAWVPSFALGDESVDRSSLTVMDKAAPANDGDEGGEAHGAEGEDGSDATGDGEAAVVSTTSASAIQTAAATGWQPKPTKTISGTGSFPLTISDGEVVQINGPIDYTAPTGKSPITIAEGATAKIIINGSVTLNGADASGTTGATAGINVPEGASLTIYSAHDEELSTSTAAPKDTLTVTGGDAAAGANGGDSIHHEDPRTNVLLQTGIYHTWDAGSGGNGGGGAAAAIGGNGGNGGAGATGAKSPAAIYRVQGVYPEDGLDDNAGDDGSPGSTGSQGQGVGSVNVNGRLTVSLAGGGAAKGGNGGAGSGGFASTGDADNMVGGCGGGGGGGGGCAAAAIGSGGAGGSGGGAGGLLSSDHKGNVQGCGGGGGGGGWPNGGGGGGGGAECSKAENDRDNTSEGGAGGAGGAAGSTGSSGSSGTQTGTSGHGRGDANPGSGGAGGSGIASSSAANGGSGGSDTVKDYYDGGDGGRGGASVSAKSWSSSSTLALCTAANMKSVSSSVRNGYLYGDGDGQGSPQQKTAQVVIDLMDCAITLNPSSYTYKGSACQPSISTITYNASSDRDGSLVYGSARTLSSSSVSLGYGENIHCDTGTVTATGKQDSTRTTVTSDGAAVGSKTIEFDINKATLTTTISADNASPYEDSPVTLTLSDYTSPTAGSGALSDLLRESSQKYEGPQVKWEVVSGTGEFSGEGTQVTFTPTSSGAVKVRATLSDMNDFTNYTTAEFTINAQARQALSASLSADTPHPRKEVSVTGLPSDVGNVSYQWQAGGKDIDGATSATYTPSNDDIGKTLSVVVTPGSDSKYAEATLTTANAVENHKWGRGTNGFCSVCDEYEPATLQSGTYRISNGGQLFWFAALVNGDAAHADFDAQDAGADGLLTGDVSLDNRTWAPISGFTGSFDGDGHTISGFSIPDAGSDSGLFGTMSGATVQDFTLEGSIALSGDRKEHVGGVVGAMTGGTLSGVTSKVGISSSSTNSAHIGGVVGNASSGSPVITKCVFEGSVDLRSETECIGGVVGYAQTAQISYCANRGTVKASASGAYVGGILGYLNSTQASVSHCYNYGTVENGGGNYCGAIVGWLRSANKAAFTDNCHLDSSASYAYGQGSTSTSSIKQPAFSSDAFASGEACYWVNGGETDADGAAWRQDVDNGNEPYDDYPVFDGDIVLRNEAHDCTAGSVTYSYSNSAADFYHYNHAFANGFCSCCDEREEASQSNGVYQITNGGQLFWFAEQLNAGAIDAGSSVTLTGDIDLEGSADGEAAGYDGIAKDRNFPGISTEERNFTGTFDGGKHTVSDYYMDTSGSGRAFFWKTDGATVRDFTLEGSLVLGSTKNDSAGVIGNMKDGTLSGVTSKVNISSTGTSTGHIGGLVGSGSEGSPVITKCVFAGSIELQSESNSIGGIVGYHATAQVSYCANLGTVKSTASNAEVGGISGRMANSQALVSHCYNYGAVQNGGGNYCGAIVGRMQAHSDANITDNCYLDGSAPSAVGSGSQSLSSEVPALSKARFDSGEACYLVNGKTSTGDEAQWRQDVDNGITPYDAYPLFDEQGVVYFRSDDSYSNYPEEVSVTVSWGAMRFGYNEGAWDPDTHSYSGGWTPATDDANDLTVTNSSNVALGAAIGFKADSALDSYDLTGSFNGYTEGTVSRMARGGGTLSTELRLRSLSVTDLLESGGETELGTVTVQLTTVGGGA